MWAKNIDEVLVILDRIIADSKVHNSNVGYFAALYRGVTRKVRDGIRAGDFDDGPRMDQLDTAFANRYFQALSAWGVGQKASRSWRVALNATTESNLMILQHLLLGMNAHINFDLGIAAAEIMPPDEIAGLENDFNRINDILAAQLGPVQDAVNSVSPMFDLLDRIGGRTDEAIATFSIDAAREMAWHQARILNRMDRHDHVNHIRQQDRLVAFLGNRLANPSGVLGASVHLIALSETDSTKAVIEVLEAV